MEGRAPDSTAHSDRFRSRELPRSAAEAEAAWSSAAVRRQPWRAMDGRVNTVKFVVAKLGSTPSRRWRYLGLAIVRARH